VDARLSGRRISLWRRPSSPRSSCRPAAVAFRRVDRTARLVVVPYLRWVASAVVLNYRFLALG